MNDLKTQEASFELNNLWFHCYLLKPVSVLTYDCRVIVDVYKDNFKTPPVYKLWSDVLNYNDFDQETWCNLINGMTQRAHREYKKV